MSIALSQVEEVMREMDFRYARTDEEHLLFGVRTEVESYRIVLNLDEDGEYLSLSTWQLLVCEAGHPNLDEVLLLLARANDEYKIVQLGWNPADGEIVAVVAVPLEDNDSLEEPQLGQALATMVLVCDDVLPALREALAGQGPAPVEAPPPGPPSPEAPGVPAPGAPASVLAGIPRAAWLMFSAGVLLMGIAALLAALRPFVH